VLLLGVVDAAGLEVFTAVAPLAHLPHTTSSAPSMRTLIPLPKMGLPQTSQSKLEGLLRILVLIRD